MPLYEVTAADRRPVPHTFHTTDRHLGLQGDELERPFAHYFTDRVAPVQAHVLDVVGTPGLPSELGYDLSEIADHLPRAGYDPIETGWTKTPSGAYAISCLTDMPGVTSEMWDWWMGWHSRDSARYKLWHPDAHAYSGVAEDRSADRTLTFRQRYIDNVSFVDEYLGTDLHRLTVRFFDPSKLGFPDVAGTTYLCGRVGLSDVPIAAGWLVHQVRPTEGGAEMRSRFFLGGDPEILDLPGRSVGKPRAGQAINSPAGRLAIKPGLPKMVSALANPSMSGTLLWHCAQEMNHLAGFLPQLFDEFRDMP